MIVNKGNVEAIFKGYSILFAQEYQGGGDPLWPQIAKKVTSTSIAEEHDFLNSFPKMRELLGQAVVQNLRASKFIITNREWESTIELPERDVRTDRMGLYAPRAEMMGRSARQHPDELIAQLLKDGFTTGLDYTGTAFFSANKASYPGATTFTNFGTGQLSVARFETARANLKGRLNDVGQPLGLGQDLVLVVSPKWEAMARKIVVAETVNGGETNVNKGTARVVVWPQLGAQGMEDYWFLMEAGWPVKPFVFQEEQAPAYNQVTDPSDSFVVLNHKFLFQVYASYNAGYQLPQLIWGSNGTVA
jgi:phage major head subunit gpT-like protein